MSKFKEPYFLRRLLYAALAFVLVVATGFGWVSESQSDQVLEQTDKLLNVLVVLALSLASVKATPASDQKPSAASNGE